MIILDNKKGPPNQVFWGPFFKSRSAQSFLFSFVALSAQILPENSRTDSEKPSFKVFLETRIPKGYYVSASSVFRPSESAPVFRLESPKQNFFLSGSHLPAPGIVLLKNGSRTAGYQGTLQVEFKVESSNPHPADPFWIEAKGDYSICNLAGECKKFSNFKLPVKFRFNAQKNNSTKLIKLAPQTIYPSGDILQIPYKRNSVGDFEFSLDGALLKYSGTPEFFPQNPDILDLNRPLVRNGFSIVAYAKPGLASSSLPIIDGLLVFQGLSAFRVTLSPQ